MVDGRWGVGQGSRGLRGGVVHGASLPFPITLVWVGSASGLEGGKIRIKLLNKAVSKRDIAKNL